MALEARGTSWTKTHAQMQVPDRRIKTAIQSIIGTLSIFAIWASSTAIVKRILWAGKASPILALRRSVGPR